MYNCDLLKDTTNGDPYEARTRDPSALSRRLYHCAGLLHCKHRFNEAIPMDYTTHDFNEELTVMKKKTFSLAGKLLQLKSTQIHHDNASV